MLRWFLSTCFLMLLSGCSNFEITPKVEYIKIKNTKTKNIFYGVVKAKNSSDLSFQSEGKIIYLPYSKGDYVKKGATIARLDGVLYLIQKHEQEAKLKEYLVQKDKQKRYYDRLDILHSQGAISDNDWENAYFEYQTTLQQIKIQKEKINYINKELSYNAIVAPYDGYISQKFLDVDSYANIAKPVVRFISSNGAQVEVMIGENLINQIKLDDKVSVEVQNYVYQGNIAHISKSSLNTGGYLIKIAIKETSTLLKEGMSAKISFNSIKNKNIFLPINLIQEENGKKYVYKIINIKNDIGEIKKAIVKTGTVIDDNIEIIDGIKEGDFVAINYDGENKKVRI